MPKQADTLKDYDRVIIKLFNQVFTPRQTRLPFTRENIEKVASDLKIKIKNLGDVPYTYRVRGVLPDAITEKGNWVIEGTGKGKYAFVLLKRDIYVSVPEDLAITDIPDATPEIILKYGGPDEQGLLAQIRYNRLIDTFLSLTAYHLQGHLRSFVKDVGQVEIDDLYVGVNTNGEWFVIPVEAKGRHPTDRLGVIQVGQLIAFARQNYPELTLRPVGVKGWLDGSIFLMEFNVADELDKIRTIRYKRYRLVREEKK
jgi:hypothetical protein